MFTCNECVYLTTAPDRIERHAEKTGHAFSRDSLSVGGSDV